MDEFDLFSQFGQPTLPRPLGISNYSNPTSADIARAHQLRAMQAQPRQPQYRPQNNYYQQSNPRPQQPQQSFPPRNMSMADQYADLTKDPGGMRQQMAGVGNTIGNALRANSQAMTDAGVGPLAPYSEKNPGPYNFMGPAMYGGESADKIAKEKAAMFPGMGGMFGGGMGMMGGGMGYIPKPEDLQRQIDYMDTMDMVKRRHQQNAAEAFQQNTMQYPAYANMFGTMLNGIFGGNRQQFPTSFSTNYGASGGMTQPPAQQKAPGNLQDGYTNRQQPSLLNQVFRRY